MLGIPPWIKYGFKMDYLCGNFSSSTPLQFHHHLCREIQQNCILELNVMKCDKMLLWFILFKVFWVCLGAIRL